MQISEQFKIFNTHSNLNFRICTIIGGLDFIAQSQAVSTIPHVIIATPGRLVDHLETNTDIKLDRVRFLVLDEADRLLQKEFGSELEVIMARLGSREQRQTLMYTATLTEAILMLKDKKDAHGNTVFFHQSDTK